jgi:predicted transporter
LGLPAVVAHSNACSSLLALGYPKEFWLRLTNSVMGIVLLILLALVIIGLAIDVIRKWGKRSSRGGKRELRDLPHGRH